MIEKSLYDYLALRSSVSVYMEKPADNVPAEYILLHKSGGTERDRLRSAIVLVKCISTVSLYRAASICEEVIGLMEGANALPDVARCKPNSPGFNNSDVASHVYRYDATFDLVHY